MKIMMHAENKSVWGTIAAAQATCSRYYNQFKRTAKALMKEKKRLKQVLNIVRRKKRDG